MGGRGARAATGGGGGFAGGGGFTIGAGGAATIIPPNKNANPNAQNVMGAGAGVSNVDTHTTYFSPADYATVSNANTDGFDISPRTGMRVAVGYYQTGYYANVNSELRDLSNGNRSSLSPKTQKVVDAMDRNMRPLDKPIDTVRWTDMRALSDNLQMPGANKTQVINRLKNNDITAIKTDYTSSSWDAKQNAVAGQAQRYVRMDMHYSKGAMVQFSPTRKEGEMVGARGVSHRFANARIERTTVQNGRYGNRTADVLVVDVYID